MITAKFLSCGSICSSGENANVLVKINDFDLDCELRFFEFPKWEQGKEYDVDLYFDMKHPDMGGTGLCKTKHTRTPMIDHTKEEHTDCYHIVGKVTAIDKKNGEMCIDCGVPLVVEQKEGIQVGDWVEGTGWIWIPLDFP